MTRTVTIRRLGHHGDGIADGPVFVPLTLPGETVEGTTEGDRLVDTRIVTPSPDRVTAPCPHFRSCGGCAVQHASDRFVAAWKTDVIRAALAAHDLAAVLRPIVTSPPWSRRRAILSGRRTKKGALVGFHARRSDTIVALRGCPILSPALFATLPVLEQITRLGASRSATLSLAVTETESGVDLSVTGGKALDPALQMALPQFRETFVRLSWDGEIVYSDVAPTLAIGPVTVMPPPGAFLQATRHGELALQSAVSEAVGSASRIADLFAGCGTFTFPLAPRAAIHAVEAAPDLLQALDTAVRHAQGLKPVTTEQRDLFRRPLVPDELARFEAVIVDPPRSGAEAQCHELASALVPRIAMVSCNPVSFARDAAILIRAGYRLNWVQPVDQFRWSTHVELAARFDLPHLP